MTLFELLYVFAIILLARGTAWLGVETNSRTSSIVSVIILSVLYVASLVSMDRSRQCKREHEERSQSRVDTSESGFAIYFLQQFWWTLFVTVVPAAIPLWLLKGQGWVIQVLGVAASLLLVNLFAWLRARHRSST